MKSLCITGNTQYGVDQLAHVVAQAGARPALPAQRTPEVSMSDWHDAVLTDRLNGGVGLLAAPTSLGRIWDQLAGDIFLANRTHPLWFWADTRSTALLDFWLEFDINTRFVLVYTDPVTALTNALLQENSQERSLVDVLEQWMHSTRQLMRFHLRQPERSVLLSHTCVAQPAECIVALAQRLGLDATLTINTTSVAAVAVDRSLNDAMMHAIDDAVRTTYSALDIDIYHTESPQTSSNSYTASELNTEVAESPVGSVHSSALARHLVSQYLELFPQALALHEEALACLTFTGSDAEPLTVLPPEQALACWLQESVQEKNRLAALLQALEAQLFSAQSELQQERQGAQLLIERLQGDLGTVQAELKASQAAYATLNQQHTASQAQQKETVEENELLLEQLHLVQEELEKAFSWKEHAEKNVQQAEALSKEVAALKVQIVTLEGQTKQAMGDLKVANEKAAALDAQAKKAQAELKASTDKASTLDAQLKKIQTELKASTDQVTMLAAQLKTAQADLKTANDKVAVEGARKVAELEHQLKDTTEENELLLEQLHMVQEELERYYLNLKQAEADKAQLQTELHEHAKARQSAQDAQINHLEQRIARMYARNPNYWDCGQVAIRPLPVQGDTEITEWTLTDLETGGRFIPQLVLKTVVRQGVAGVLITRLGEGDAPLQRWPAAFAQATELPCVAVAGTPFESTNLALSSLSAADWAVLQNVVLFLVSSLEQAQPGSLPPGLHRERLMKALAHYAKTLQNWPAVARFDQIQIEPVTSIPNYAGLDIHLKGIRIGGVTLPELQYRLASVDPEAGRFGQHPRLEFPESSKSVLASWFAESSDDRGNRLELRFAQPNAMDIRVWQQLQAQDQSIIAALIATLPVQLTVLGAVDVQNAPVAQNPASYAQSAAGSQSYAQRTGQGASALQQTDQGAHVVSAPRSAQEWQALAQWMINTLGAALRTTSNR